MKRAHYENLYRGQRCRSDYGTARALPFTRRAAYFAVLDEVAERVNTLRTNPWRHFHPLVKGKPAPCAMDFVRARLAQLPRYRSLMGIA